MYAARIVKENNPIINLKGIAIGNPWIDPATQYRTQIDFMEENNLPFPPNMDDLRMALSGCDGVLKLKEMKEGRVTFHHDEPNPCKNFEENINRDKIKNEQELERLKLEA